LIVALSSDDDGLVSRELSKVRLNFDYSVVRSNNLGNIEGVETTKPFVVPAAIDDQLLGLSVV